jgi:hypothetical protein
MSMVSDLIHLISRSAATLISVVSLLVSVTVAWLTLFRRGRLRMTRPTLIAFLHEKGSTPDRKTMPKIFLRTLLYSSGKFGHVVENMFVDILHEQTRYPFYYWSHGDARLVPGSGLFVGPEGVACNHHFMPRTHTPDLQFGEGEYRLEVFASIVGQKIPLRLYSVRLHLSQAAAIGLQAAKCAYFFEWDPHENGYVGHVEAPQHE